MTWNGLAKASRASEVCAGCGGVKRRGQVFCPSCFGRLSPIQRAAWLRGCRENRSLSADYCWHVLRACWSLGFAGIFIGGVGYAYFVRPGVKCEVDRR